MASPDDLRLVKEILVQTIRMACADFLRESRIQLTGIERRDLILSAQITSLVEATIGADAPPDQVCSEYAECYEKTFNVLSISKSAHV